MILFSKKGLTVQNEPQDPSAARKLWLTYRAWVETCNSIDIERLNLVILAGMLAIAALSLGWWPTDQWEPAAITRAVSIIMTVAVGIFFAAVCIVRFDVHLTKDAQRYAEDAARDLELERLRKQVAESN